MKSKVTPFLTLKLNLPKITMGVDFFHKNFEGGSTGDGIQKILTEQKMVECIVIFLILFICKFRFWDSWKEDRDIRKSNFISGNLKDKTGNSHNNFFFLDATNICCQLLFSLFFEVKRTANIRNRETSNRPIVFLCLVLVTTTIL